MKKTFFLAGLLVGIVILFAVIYMPQTQTNNNTATTSGKVLIGGTFTLTDTEGNNVHDTDFRGKLMLVYFGFTYCPDICPLGLQTISEAMDMLKDKQDDVQPLFVTIDPERDNVEQMKSYMAHFSDRIRGLTGTKEQISQAAEAYRIYYNKVPNSDNTDYLMDHSSFIYLMDRNGEYITHFPSSATAEQIAETIRKY